MKFTYSVHYFFEDLFGNRGYNNAIISTNYPVINQTGVELIAREMSKKIMYQALSILKIQLLKSEAV